MTKIFVFELEKKFVVIEQADLGMSYLESLKLSMKYLAEHVPNHHS